MTTLRSIVTGASHLAARVAEDTAILNGKPVLSAVFADNIGEPYRWGRGVTMSRQMMRIYGVVEPTTQERADESAAAERTRAWVAARIARQAEWFSALHDAAGPVGGAMLDLHVPGWGGDCEGDGFEAFAGLPWPCDTVRAAAAAAGIDVPEDI